MPEIPPPPPHPPHGSVKVSGSCEARKFLSRRTASGIPSFSRHLVAKRVTGGVDLEARLMDYKGAQEGTVGRRGFGDGAGNTQ